MCGDAYLTRGAAYLASVSIHNGSANQEHIHSMVQLCSLLQGAIICQQSRQCHPHSCMSCMQAHNGRQPAAAAAQHHRAGQSAPVGHTGGADKQRRRAEMPNRPASAAQWGRGEGRA